MKERYSFEKEYLVAKTENKGKVMLYTLLEVGTFNKMVAIGNITEGLKEMDKVTVKIDITIENKRLELKNGDVKFTDVASKFIDKVEKVKE